GRPRLTRLTQIGQQRRFVVEGQHGVRAPLAQACFAQLRQQAFDRNSDLIRKLLYCHFRHITSPPSLASSTGLLLGFCSVLAVCRQASPPWSANQGSRAFMISAAARSSSSPPTPSKSSMDCSARSSMVRMPCLTSASSS